MGVEDPGETLEKKKIPNKNAKRCVAATVLGYLEHNLYTQTKPIDTSMNMTVVDKNSKMIPNDPSPFTILSLENSQNL